MKALFEKYKYPLIILALGLLLLLMPSSGAADAVPADEDTLLQQVLSCSKGVGEARLISSENGVVVSCQGADNARVRLEIIKAISSYTGFGSDKITILKMAK